MRADFCIVVLIIIIILQIVYRQVSFSPLLLLWHRIERKREQKTNKLHEQ